MAKIKKGAIDSAYMRIMGISKDEMNKPEHQKVIDTALKDVWGYDGLFDGEDDRLRDKRLDMTGPEIGEVSELANHFRKLYPQETKNMTGWEIIFFVRSRMNDEAVENESVEQVKVSIETQAETAESSDTKNNISQVKENETMGTQAFDELKSKLSGTSAAAKPGVDTNYKNSSRDAIMKQEVARKANSEGTVITAIVVATRKLSERCVDAENAMGTVKNVDKALTTFEQKTGARDLGDGTYVYDNVLPSDVDDAKAVHEALKKAKADPSFELKVNMGTGNGTAKGVKLTKANGETKLLPNKKLTNFILMETGGFLKSTKEGAFVKIALVSPKGKASDQLTSEKATEVSSVAALKWQERSKLMEDSQAVLYEKEVIKSEHSKASGAKSELKVRYKTDKLTTKGEPKMQTYRIPLEVDMYKTEVIDEEIKAAFPQGSGTLGRKLMDLNNADDVKALGEEVIKIYAVMAENGINDPAFAETLEAIRAGAAEAEQTEGKEAAAEFAGV